MLNVWGFIVIQKGWISFPKIKGTQGHNTVDVVGKVVSCNTTCHDNPCGSKGCIGKSLFLY